MGRKIGILGGTFNPIHNAHLTLGEFARDTFQLDKVLFMPANIPALKDTSMLISKEHRVNMVKLAIQSNSNFELTTIEVDKEGKSYTADTFEELVKLYSDDELCLIIGADSFFQLEKWKKFRRLFELTSFIVAVRENYHIEDLDNKKKYYEEQYGAKVYLLNMPNIEISSTLIRTRIADKKSVKYLLNDDCQNYILKNDLYSS